MNDEHVDVAIVGGGAAGCLLALALGEAGLSVSILERNQHLPFNGGEFLKPTGIRALQRYGFGPFIAEHGLRRNLISYYHDGDALFTYDYAKCARIGYYVIIPYTKLLDGIVKRIQELSRVHIRVGVGNATPRQEDNTFTFVELENGARVYASIIVGADGVRSSVRAAMEIAEQPRRGEHNVYMACFPAVDSVMQQNRLYLSSTHWIAYFYPLDQDRFRLAVCARSEDAKPVFAGNAEDLVRRLRSFVVESDDALARVRSLDGFACLPTSDLHTSTYRHKNMVLLGDAAHTVHPLTGQGMNLALGDVGDLADAILSWSNGSRTLADALAYYENARRPVIEQVRQYGRGLAESYHERSRYLAAFDTQMHAGDI